MTAVAKAFSVSVETPTTPTWTRGAVNQWVTVPGSALLPHMYPNPPISTGGGGSNSVGIYAYSAGALHPTTLKYYTNGGGHSDYAGNEVYEHDLTLETPTPVKLSPNTQPSGGSMWAAGGTAGDGYAYYWDGRPASRHTWYSCAQIIPSYGTQGQLLLMGAGAVWGSGNGSFRTIDTWDIAAREYTWINPAPLAAPNGPNPNFTAYDSTHVYNDAVKDARGDLWVTLASQGTQSGTVKWSPATKAWTNLVAVSRSTSGCIAYDSLRDRIVNFPTGTGNTGHYFSALNGSGVTFFAWGSAPTNLAGRYQGIAWYEPDIDRFVYIPQGTLQLWHIHPTTFVAVQQTTTGTPPAMVADAASNSGSGLAMLGNRFHYIPQYRGCICFTQVSQNAAFIRTS